MVLSQAQRALVRRWEQEKQRKDFIEALAQHILLYRHAACIQAAPAQVQTQNKRRTLVIAWFQSLNLPQRAAVLTVTDPYWVDLVSNMCNARKGLQRGSDHVLVMPPCAQFTKEQTLKGRHALAGFNPEVDFRFSQTKYSKDGHCLSGE
jgi:hypothetical protein